MRAPVQPAGPARARTDPGAPRPPSAAAASKTSLHASERDTARVQRARAADQQEVAPVDPRRFTCIDESGVNLALTRLYGRAPRGARVTGAVPQHDGANVTMLAALGSPGVDAVMTIDGAADAEVCRVDGAQVRRPTPRPGDLVIMDNLRARKAAGIREAIEHAGAPVRYWPPDSPDVSPIEPWWSTLKTAWRTAKARTREALEQALAHALATITVSDARSWFHHGGYALQWFENRSRTINKDYPTLNWYRMIESLPSYKINRLIRISASTIECNHVDKEKVTQHWIFSKTIASYH
jgi:transposase